MLISQPNLPWLFRLKAVSPANFETDCQNVQFAQLTFWLQVICGLCAVKPQNVHTHMGIIMCISASKLIHDRLFWLLRRLNLGELVLINIFRERT